MRDLPTAVARFDSNVIREALDARGYWVSPPLLEEATCARIAKLYDAEDVSFRSTVTMARHGFGQGEYKYFGHPLPEIVTTLRKAVYERLVPVANQWSIRWGREGEWPNRHDALVERCAAAGQERPTPLLLRYTSGDYNCLHQDLYGEIHFPLQAIVLLDRPTVDFEGGELVLVEHRLRRQSKVSVVPLIQGSLAVIPVKERPIAGAKGTVRSQIRHGVAEVRYGVRRTLGLIFHDAA